jgi:hypothetical protein
LQQAYKKISKELVPTKLFPSKTEYQIALESYLAEHADHYIGSLGKNGWISLFEEKLLPEVHEIINNYQKKKQKKKQKKTSVSFDFFDFF